MNTEIGFTPTSAYLNLPVTFDRNRLVRFELLLDGTVVRSFDLPLAAGEPDYWVHLDLRPFAGHSVGLRAAAKPDGGPDPERAVEFADAMGLVHQSETAEHLDGLYRERLRPQFHFTAPRGWINDPNGLV